jgi:cellulose biosynthesis protein BcsQ
MKITLCGSIKGGCRKTGTAVFLFLALAHRGRSALLVDVDHNNNAGDFFLRDTDPDEMEARNVITGKMKPAAAVYRSPLGVDVLPATPTLSGIGYDLTQDPGALLRFPAALRRLDHDYAVIDSPPAVGFELRAGIYSADIGLAPVALARWTVQGFKLLRREFDLAAETVGRAATLRALPSICTEKEALAFREISAWTLTNSSIIKSGRIKTATHYGTALKEGTRPWSDFEALTAEETL